MRAKNGWSVETFYGGHAFLHLLPLLIARTAGLHLGHGLAAGFLHLMWSLCVNLDALYVPLAPWSWIRLMAVAVVTEVVCPLAYMYN